MAGGVNLYAYAAGNPVSYSDPYGLCEPFCTALDAALLAADISDLRQNGPSVGNVAGIVLGAGCTAVPGVTGCGAVDDAVRKGIELGIESYGKVRATARLVGGEAHHLVEKRFAAVLGMKPSEMQAIVLPKSVHQAFTNAWRKAISYGSGTASATREQIAKAAQNIYAEYAELVKAAQKDASR